MHKGKKKRKEEEEREGEQEEYNMDFESLTWVDDLM